MFILTPQQRTNIIAYTLTLDDARHATLTASVMRSNSRSRCPNMQAT